jgi:4a-hydroxytetrahydrobiopterin dehydratase
MSRMSAPLDEPTLAAELELLPRWSGDTSRIERTVLLPPHLDAEVRRRVATVADEVDHHPVVEDVAGGARYVLWTHVRGGVTDKDVDLAARIDRIVAEVNGFVNP